MKKVMKHIFLKLMFNILKNYMNFIIIYHFYLRGKTLKKLGKLVANLHDKTECYTHKKFKRSIKLWISFEKSLCSD